MDTSPKETPIRRLSKMFLKALLVIVPALLSYVEATDKVDTKAVESKAATSVSYEAVSQSVQTLAQKADEKIERLEKRVHDLEHELYLAAKRKAAAARPTRASVGAVSKAKPKPEPETASLKATVNLPSSLDELVQQKQEQPAPAAPKN